MLQISGNLTRILVNLKEVYLNEERNEGVEEGLETGRGVGNRTEEEAKVDGRQFDGSGLEGIGEECQQAFLE